MLSFTLFQNPGSSQNFTAAREIREYQSLLHATQETRLTLFR
jgi:hypothetical protein